MSNVKVKNQCQATDFKCKEKNNTKKQVDRGKDVTIDRTDLDDSNTLPIEIENGSYQYSINDAGNTSISVSGGLLSVPLPATTPDVNVSIGDDQP